MDTYDSPNRGATTWRMVPSVINRSAHGTRTRAMNDSSTTFHSFGLSSGSAQDPCVHLVGETIDGRYTLENWLGEGGFGCVFLARQRSPSRQVAVKVQKHAGRESQRMTKEADLLARLDDRGIARVYEAGDWASPTGPRIFVAMELIVGGQPLHRFCADHRLSDMERLQLFREVCRSVGVAHHEGIIHRDLKPGNILVDKRGQPRVIDFGISKLVTSDVEPPVGNSAASSRPGPDETRVGAFLGTPTYASPEQQRGQATPQSDVHALGMILKNDLFADVGGGTPACLKPLVARCTAGDPRSRPRDAAELAAEVDHVIRVLARRRRLPLRVAVAAAVVLTGGVATFFVRSGKPPIPESDFAVMFQDACRTAAGDPTAMRLATAVGDKVAVSVSGKPAVAELRLQVAPLGARGIAFGEAGTLVAASDAAAWSVWDLNTIEMDSSPVFQVQADASSASHDGLIAISPNGGTLFAQNGPRSLVAFAPRSTARLGTVTIQDADSTVRVTSLIPTALTDTAVAGLSDGSMRRWSLTKGTTEPLGIAHGPGPMLLAATVDGCRFAACGADGRVVMYDGTTAEVLCASLPITGMPTALCCGEPGDVVVATKLPGGAEVIRLSDTGEGSLTVTGSMAAPRPVTALAYTGSGFVAVAPDPTVLGLSESGVMGVSALTAAAGDPGPR